MKTNINRRDFIAASAAMIAATQQPSLPAPARIGAIANPPPPPGGTVVLFQGDSITDCGRDRNSPAPNQASALGDGYPLLVAAAVLAAKPADGLQFFNRGISGNKVPDLEQRWERDALDFKPDVLSILIGVNDFWHKLDHGYTGTVQDYERQYAALLDATRRALPHVRLIVLEPFVLRTGAVGARWFPEFDQRRAAAARVAAQAKATFVPLQAVFDSRVKSTPPEYWAADGVHPTPAGHGVIAEQWRRAAHV